MIHGSIYLSHLVIVRPFDRSRPGLRSRLGLRQRQEFDTRHCGLVYGVDMVSREPKHRSIDRCTALPLCPS